MKITPVIAWYDFWVGVYWDRKARRLYVLPLPCWGLCFEFSAKDSEAPAQSEGTTLKGKLHK